MLHRILGVIPQSSILHTKYVCTELQRLERCNLNMLSPTKTEAKKGMSSAPAEPRTGSLRHLKSVRGSWTIEFMVSDLWPGHRSSGVCSDYRTRTFSAPNGRFLEAFAVLHGQVKTGGRTRQSPSPAPAPATIAAAHGRSVVAVRANTRKRDAIPAAVTTAGRVPGLPTPQPLNSFQPLSNA